MNTSTLLKRTSRLLIKRANELLKPYGVTHAYTYFLMELYEQDGLTQSDLYKRIGIEQPTAVRTLDRMERDGFVFRKRDSVDRRAIRIQLSDKGKQHKKLILACAKELNCIALKGFSENEHKTINQLIMRLNINLSADSV